MNNHLFALRATAQVQPDIAIPSSGKVTGFLFDASKIGGFRGEHIAVYPAWSKANSHGVAGNDVSLSGGRSLFSSRLLALQALRSEIESRFAPSFRPLIT